MNILIVVDMQNDFVSGSLGTAEAKLIVDPAKKKIETAIANGEKVIFTRDTHLEDYLSTQEGKNLPVEHCIRYTRGWDIVDELKPLSYERPIFDKPGFGSPEIGAALLALSTEEKIDKITVIGLCTDICVITIALMVKAFLPETEVCVDAACCAGVTPEGHKTALAAMKPCQIKIENE